MGATIKILSRSLSSALLVVALGALTGCGAGRAMIIQPPETKLRASSAEFSEGKSPVSVPVEVKSALQGKLSEFLYAEGNGFKKGSELKIVYRFIQYDPGSQLTRWFWGGIGNAGEGSLTIETKYFDGANKELATIHTEGRIGSGFFGGDFNFAIEKAAEKMAEYAINNFK